MAHDSRTLAGKQEKECEMKTVSLVQAGARLKLSYTQTLRLVMTGELKGQQTPAGRWVVDEHDLLRLLEMEGAS